LMELEKKHKGIHPRCIACAEKQGILLGIEETKKEILAEIDKLLINQGSHSMIDNEDYYRLKGKMLGRC